MTTRRMLAVLLAGGAMVGVLVRTLTGVQGTKKVQLLLDGSAATARFPGHLDGQADQLSQPADPQRAPRAAAAQASAPDPEVKALQQKLIQLGYMIRGDAAGRFGAATQNAILAFQKWERLPRTGLMDAKKHAARYRDTPGADHRRRRREARRDLARPPGRLAHQRRDGHPRDQAFVGMSVKVHARS